MNCLHDKKKNYVQDNDRSDLGKHHRQRWETFVGNRWSSKILLNMTHATYFNLKASKSFWEVITRINSTSLVRQETKSTYLGSSTLTSTTQRISLIGQLQFSVIILRMPWIILQDLKAITYLFWILRRCRCECPHAAHCWQCPSYNSSEMLLSFILLS